MNRNPLTLAVLTLLMTSSLHAQTPPAQSGEKPQKIEELSLESLLSTPIEISSRTAETIFQTTSTVSVIDQETIRRYNFRSVAEAVGTLAGFDVLRTHIMRNVPTSRGILEEHYANKVLVMINGVAQWSAVTGEANLDRVDINDVERIEVLKGPASVLYGTNAYSGAVNIITKRSQQAPLEGHFDIGQNGLLGGGAHIGWGSGDRSFFAGANSYSEIGRNTVFIDEHNESGHLNEFMEPSNVTAVAQRGGHSILFNASTVRESFLGTTPEWALGIGHPQTRRGYLANYGYTHKFGKATLSSSISYDWTRRDFSRSRDDVTRSIVEGRRISPSVSLNVRMSDSLSFDVGADYDHRKSERYANIDTHKDVVLAQNNMQGRTVAEYSGFAQVAYHHGPLRLLAGSRVTNNQLFGTNTSSRGTLVFSLNDRNAVKVIAGQSYRAPSLFELYFQTPTNTTYGNVDLKPETSTSYELAYLTHTSSFFGQILAYHADYHDKIFRTRRFPDSQTDKSTMYINGQTFNADGVELEMKYQPATGVSAFLNYNYIRGNKGDRIASEDHYNFKYVPKNSVSGGLATTFSDWLASAVLNYTGATRGALAPIGSQTTFDLNLGYTQAMSTLTLRHKLSVKNVTDHEVEIPEYVRRIINSIPSGFGRQVVYSVQITGGK